MGGPLTVNTEAQQLLREFEEATGERAGGAGEGSGIAQTALPKRVAQVPRPHSTLLLTQEEQGELEPLKGNFDWEAIKRWHSWAGAGLAGDPGAEPATEPCLTWGRWTSPSTAATSTAQPPGGPSVGAGCRQPGLGETFLATSFLHAHPWDRAAALRLPGPLFEAGGCHPGH